MKHSFKSAFAWLPLWLGLSFSCGGAPREEVGGQGSQGVHSADAVHAAADDHPEESLGVAVVGAFEVELAQGHGAVAAGKEGHLVVKLPYSDDGATVVRAWIGSEDRTMSFVGKGTYASSHGDYDVHALAPSPLPEDCRWWIELEGADGTKSVGSATPIFE